MPDSHGLKAAVERLTKGTSSEADRLEVQHSLLVGRLVYTTGDRDVAIGGDATGSIIITGDQNLISFELPDSAYERLRDRLFPAPQGLPPPFPNLIFIGREEARQEVKGLLGIGGAAPARSSQAIGRGWPGVGKTTLVSVLSRDPEVAAAYPDGVLWTSLDQNPSLMSILAAWGRALGNDGLLKVPTPEEAAEQIGDMLYQRRMLLIVDDVWDAGHGALFQRSRGKDCGLLITTRLPEVANSLSQVEKAIYNLPVLTDDEALKLMRILAPTIVTQHEEECLELVRDLEFLPLALHVAARLLRAESTYGWGVSDLLKDIREGAALMEKDAPADRAQGDAIPTVRALLNKSTDLLDEMTRDCYAYLGVFAPKPATFDLEAMKTVWQQDDPRPTVRSLVQHGLLEPLGGGRFQIHALLVKHARSFLTDD
jgi:hypothetical protein